MAKDNKLGPRTPIDKSLVKDRPVVKIKGADMPYMKVNNNGKWQVFKKSPDGQPMGDMMGEHDSEEEANSQMAALYASEDKTKCGYMDEESMYVPWGITSFADLEAAEALQESAQEVKKYTNAFSQLASNILGADITDKATALGRLATDYASRVASLMSPVRRKEHPSPTLPPPDTKEVEAGGDFCIWKEQGVYRWIAAYSNNYRDDDNPPEIISAQSHKEFDQALERKEYPMPELWPWHIPYRAGVTTLHFYDETTGFTVAAGTFDKDKEWLAEGMLQAGWDGVSHGMPSDEIQKDNTTHVITRHRTREISPLPKWAAANKLSFNVISKESNMGIPAHKRDEFVKAFGADKTDEIEKALEGKAKEAQEAGIEQKEQPVPEPTLSAQQVADAIIMAVTPLAEAIKELGTQLKELQKSDEEKVAEKAANTPAASLESLLNQKLPGLFSTANEVDGRTSLAKSKPKEATGNNSGGLFFDKWIQQ